MLRALTLLVTYLRANFQRDAEYRADFFAQIAVSLVQLGLEIGSVQIIFYRTESLGGWSREQVLALMGVCHLVSGIIGLIIAPNMRQLIEDVGQGTLDFVLLKPVSSQLLASIRSVEVWRLTDVVFGVALAVYATTAMTGGLSALQVGQFLAVLAAGAVILYSFWLTLATLAFWVVRVDNLEMIFWNVFQAARFPLSIYPVWIQRGLTYLVPLAFVTTIPARALTSTLEPSVLLLALTMAVLAALAATGFFKIGLRRYSGASA
jgi:ABC-2 type transport system permease protein